jgi:integrase
MASITKRKSGWRAEVYVNGVRECKSFTTKNEAIGWSTDRESELRRTVKSGIREIKTCEEVFEKYANQVSSKKDGGRWEKIRLTACANFIIDGQRFGDMLFKDVDATVMAKYRDMRLNTVLGSTVNREFNLLSNVFTVARKEWKWSTVNPISDVKRPKEEKPRDRLITEDEIEQLRIACGYINTVSTKRHALFIAFLFAIETALRQGEIAALTWDCVFTDHVHVARSKNGDERDVALSAEAKRLLELLPKNGSLCFRLKADYMSATFRDVRDMTLIKDLHFHDTRHEAVTRLAKKLHVLELARMTGHRDIKELMTYYNATASEVSKKL